MVTSKMAEALSHTIALLKESAEFDLKNAARAKTGPRQRPAFTEMERQIIQVIGREAMAGKAIAKALGYETVGGRAPSGVQNALSIMVRYHVLTNDETGYALEEEYYDLLDEEA